MDNKLSFGRRRILTWFLFVANNLGIFLYYPERKPNYKEMTRKWGNSYNYSSFKNFDDMGKEVKSCKSLIIECKYR